MHDYNIKNILKQCNFLTDVVLERIGFWKTIIGLKERMFLTPFPFSQKLNLRQQIKGTTSLKTGERVKKRPVALILFLWTFSSLPNLYSFIEHKICHTHVSQVMDFKGASLNLSFKVFLPLETKWSTSAARNPTWT